MALVNNEDQVDVLPNPYAPPPNYNPYAPGAGGYYDYRPSSYTPPVAPAVPASTGEPMEDFNNYVDYAKRLGQYNAKKDMIGNGIAVQMGEGDGTYFAAVTNPGTIDLAVANPAMYAELMRRAGYRNQFDQRNADFLDPARYAARKANSIQESNTRTMNSAARMGLGGSSLALGAGNEAARHTAFGWDDKQMQDELRMLQAEQMMTGGIEHSINSIQNGYANYENRVNNMKLGVEQTNAAADAADASMWSAILGTVGTVAGAYFGGPAGAAAGGAAGSALGSNLSVAPTMESQNFGTLGYPSADNLQPVGYGSSTPWYGDDY